MRPNSRQLIAAELICGEMWPSPCPSHLRKDDDLGRAAELADAIRRATGREAGQPLHFNQLHAKQKRPAAEHLGGADFLYVLTIVVKKAALRLDGLDENHRKH